MNMDIAVASRMKNEVVKETIASFEEFGAVELSLSGGKTVVMSRSANGELSITGLPLLIMGMDDRFKITMAISCIYKMGYEVIFLTTKAVPKVI